MLPRSNRPLRAGLIALIAVLCGALPALGGCGGSSSSAVPRAFYGVASNTPLEATDYGRMGDADVGSLRFSIYWPGVQPDRGGKFDWSAVDPIVTGAAVEHMDLLPILMGTPTYEAPGCADCASTIEIGTSAQRADWTRFVSAAAKRYGPDGTFWRTHPDLASNPITRWQIWNEQNNPNQRNPAPVYNRLLALSDGALKAVDPNAEVVLGGMFGTPKGSQHPGVTAWGYLNRLYDHGAAQHADAVALHPYSPTVAGIAYQVKRIRSILDSHGESATPILVTEIGWGSGKGPPAPGTGSRGQVYVVGPKQQAEKLTESFDLLTSHREDWNLEGIFWFGWKDPTNPPPGLCAFCYTSGLYEANGTTAKPALSAFTGFSKKTSGG